MGLYGRLISQRALELSIAENRKPGQLFASCTACLCKFVYMMIRWLLFTARHNTKRLFCIDIIEVQYLFG